MSYIKPVGAAMPLQISQAFSMAGKVVIVTGAAGNVGSGIAEVFAANDAKVILSDRAGEALAEVSLYLREKYPSMLDCPADLTSPDELKALVRFAQEKCGRLDAIVNCGAVPASGLITDEDAPDFDRLFHTNVRSLWLLTKYAIEPMEASGGGSIVNISSINGHRPTFLCSLYAGTKAAVLAITKELAVELAPRKIRVNSVSPGLIPNVNRRSGRMRHYLNEPWATQFAEEMEQRYETDMPRNQPLTAVGHGHDIGMACYYLCTPAARFVTGEDIVVDGGKILEMHEAEPRFYENRHSFWKNMKLRLLELPPEAWKAEKPHWLTRVRSGK